MSKLGIRYGVVFVPWQHVEKYCSIKVLFVKVVCDADLQALIIQWLFLDLLPRGIPKVRHMLFPERRCQAKRCRAASKDAIGGFLNASRRSRLRPRSIICKNQVKLLSRPRFGMEGGKKTCPAFARAFVNTERNDRHPASNNMDINLPIRHSEKAS